jgi:hypothetical protein
VLHKQENPIMTKSDRQFDDLDRDVSDRLRQDLQGLFQPPGAVPPRVDKIIVDQARRQLAQPRPLIIRLRWAAGITAAAAVVTIGMILYQGPNHQSSIVNHQSVAEGRADIDGNGRVDILDAFQLARSIEARGRVAPQWDLNGDGRVDQDDVNLVALAAVRLDSGLRGEGVPPLRREAILASLLPDCDVSLRLEVQGQDALATHPSRSTRDKGA